MLKTYCDDKEINDATSWESWRRAELLGLFHHYIYGEPPSAPDESKVKVQVEVSKDKVLDGKAIRKRLLIQPSGGGSVIRVLLYIPAEKKGPFPVFLGLNFFGNHSTIDDPEVPLATGWMPDRGEGVVDNKATEASRGTVAARWSIRQNIEAGYAVATLYHGDLDPDQPDGKNWVQAQFGATDAIRQKPQSGGTLSTWAWGLSRALDALLEDTDIDGARVWVMGHSRNGKAALLAAARDVRFAGVIANQSGCMGAAIHRGKSGETIKTIQPFFPHWFNDAFGGFVADPNKLPVDQHMLLALIAPRPLLVATATADTWSDPPAAWRGVLAAAPAWGLLGKPQPALGKYPDEKTLTGQDIAFHRRPGGHSVTADDWKTFVAFANQHK